MDTYTVNVSKEMEPTSVAGNGRGMSPGSRTTQFKQGSVPNPKGRPKGSKNKITKALLDELQRDFDEHGPAAIEQCRESNVVAYLRLFTRVINRKDPPPRCIDDDIRNLSRAELDNEIWLAVRNLIKKRCQQGNVSEAECEKFLALLDNTA